MMRPLVGSISEHRPFAHQTWQLRVLPFAGAYAVALVLYPFGDDGTYGGWFAAGAALAAATLGLIAFAPWERLPEAAHAVPLMTFLFSITCLREAHGGATSGLAPLLLVGVVWAAVFGSRRMLAAVIAAMGLAVVLPPLVSSASGVPGGELRRALTLVLVGCLIGGVIQALIGALLRAEADLTRVRADEIHDDLVQAFAVAQLAIDTGNMELASQAVADGLAAAQALSAEMLAQALPHGIEPGALRRSRPADVGRDATPEAGRARFEPR
jgi:hypothetical protein